MVEEEEGYREASLGDRRVSMILRFSIKDEMKAPTELGDTSSPPNSFGLSSSSTLFLPESFVPACPTIFCSL